jgi:hypothetical protein
MAEETARRAFNGRAFTTTLTAFSFMALAVTGLLMYAEVESHTLKSVHAVISLVAVVAAGCHLYHNWRSLLRHLQRGGEAAWTWRREWLLALLIVVVTVGGTAAGLPPFSLLAEEEHEPGAYPGGAKGDFPPPPGKGRHRDDDD